MSPADVLTAFSQGNQNNAATVGIIKLAIARYGLNKVFKSLAADGRGNYKVVLKNDEVITLNNEDLAVLYPLADFKLNEQTDNAAAKGVLKYADFCFAVMVKYVMKIEGRNIDAAVAEINSSGIHADYAYRNLGLPDDHIGFLLLNNAGTHSNKDYQHTPLYLLYNNNHCAMATYRHYDHYAVPTPITEFVSNHSSWLKPAKVCRAYELV